MELLMVFGLVAFVAVGAWVVTMDSRIIKRRRFAEFQEDEDRTTRAYHRGVN